MTKNSNYREPNQQLRMHYRQNLFHKFYYRWNQFKGVGLGKNVIIDKGAKLLRYPRNINIGNDVILKQGCHICPCRVESKVSIGDRTTIGFYTLIYATDNISVGQDCMIAPFVYLVDSDHGLKRHELMNRQSNNTAAIRIGSDVWIGAHVVILKGVEIENGAIVAAGSVVKENVPGHVIVGGVPAKILGER